MESLCTSITFIRPALPGEMPPLPKVERIVLDNPLTEDQARKRLSQLRCERRDASAFVAWTTHGMPVS